MLYKKCNLIKNANTILIIYLKTTVNEFLREPLSSHKFWHLFHDGVRNEIDSIIKKFSNHKKTYDIPFVIHRNHHCLRIVALNANKFTIYEY